MNSQLWSVCSGKGGVGKSFVAANLALTLSRIGYSVLIVDADTSGANIHTCLGLNPPSKNWSWYLSGREELANLIQSTAIPHLSFIGGGVFSGTSAQSAEKIALDLRALKFDFVVIDTAVSQTQAQMELIRKCNEVLLVTSPEPTSIEKNYRWIEQYVAYELAEDATQEARGKIERALEDFRNQAGNKVFNFRRYVKTEHGITPDHFEKLLRKPVRLIVNGIRTPNDENLSFSMKSVCQKFFDFSIDPVANIEFDNAAWQSQRNKEAFLIAKPFSPIAGELLSLAKKLSASNFSETNVRAVI